MTRTLTRPVQRVVLAATLSLVAAGAVAGPPASADTKPDKITAASAVPGTGYGAETLVMPSGRVVVTYTSAGLTKYAVGPHSIKRLGTGRVPVEPGRYPYLRTVLVHPAGGFVYVVWNGRIQVFDVSSRTPRLVRVVTADRLFPDMIRPHVIAAAFDPEGRRLLVSSSRDLRVVGTKRPARPTVGATSDLPESVGNLAVTPDGSHLVTGGADGGRGTVAVYSLPRTGAPTLERQGTVSVPGWPPSQSQDPNDWSMSVSDLVAAPNGRSAYVSVSTWGYGDTPDQAILKVRLSDLTSVALPDQGPFRTPYLQDVSANGQRVYLTYGATTDEDEHLTRAVARTDRDLTAWHDVDPVGDVLDAVSSKAGPTRGLVYVVVTTKHGLALRSVKVW